MPWSNALLARPWRLSTPNTHTGIVNCDFTYCNNLCSLRRSITLGVCGSQKRWLQFSFGKNMRFSGQFYKINCSFVFWSVFLHCELFSVYAFYWVSTRRCKNNPKTVKVGFWKPNCGNKFSVFEFWGQFRSVLRKPMSDIFIGFCLSPFMLLYHLICSKFFWV